MSIIELNTKEFVEYNIESTNQLDGGHKGLLFSRIQWPEVQSESKWLNMGVDIQKCDVLSVEILE